MLVFKTDTIHDVIILKQPKYRELSHNIANLITKKNGSLAISEESNE